MFYDLIVVGAGPIGLLTALGAARRSCPSVLVLEQARELKKVGTAIDVQPNGSKALQIVAPKLFKRLKAEHEKPPLERKWLDSSGTLQWTIRKDADPGSSLLLGWHKLQSELLSELPDTVEVRINAQVVSIEHPDDEGVRVIYEERGMRANPFTNWGVPTSADVADTTNNGRTRFSVMGRIVIGVDGIHSRVREHVYRYLGGESWLKYAKPNYIGHTQVNMFINSVPPGGEDAMRKIREKFKQLNTDAAVVESNMEEGRRLMRCIVILHGGGLLLVLIGQVDEDLVDNSSDLLTEMAEIVRCEIEWGEIVQIVDAMVAWGCENFVLNKYQLWVVPPKHVEGEGPPGFRRAFGAGRMLLAGDALHARPTTQAQGTAMGFEDACELVDLLAKTFAWEEQKPKHVTLQELETLEEQYREIRLHRLCLASDNSVSPPRLSSLDKLKALRKELITFTPVASGWKNCPE